jgi:molybdopterin synthase catalytic subunit
MKIAVQHEDFDLSAETRRLCEGRHDIGATVSFSGLVRDMSSDQSLVALELEHYPGMTEKALTEIANEACARWEITDLTIVHRVGRLAPGDNIVLVITASPHRREAFEACEFLMDYLKTRAPFWKKEVTRQGESWVASRDSDSQAAERWSKAD